MVNKQKQTGKPTNTRSPIQQSHINIKKIHEEGDKRPFISLPILIHRVAHSPQSITPTDAAQLQRTIGNQALGRLLIQPKLTLGPVGDKYEQEADAVAKQVVGRISDTGQSPVQRQEEEDEVQMSPVSSLQRQEEDEELQMMPALSLQRQEEDEEQLQMKSSSTLSGDELSSGIENKIQSAKGDGLPLSPNTQSNMEQAFKANFSRVKIHTDNQSDQLNQAIQARAFTTGQDIFFRQGEYNPGSSSGQELLAHELTHTIQQTGGQAQRQSVVQRLIMTRDFMANAGIAKKKKKGEMGELLHALDKYQVQEAFLSLHPSDSHYTTVLQLLDIVETKAKAWQNTTGKSLGVGRFFRKGAGTRHKNKKTAVTTLLNEIKTEKEVLTKKKENLQTQQEMLTALDETKSRPNMVTSYIEQPLTETNPEMLVKKLELSQKVISIQIDDLLKRKIKGETLDEDEITAVGKSLQGLNVVAGQLFSIADYKKGTTTITGKFEESLKGALEVQVKGSDPKRLYTYTHLGDTVGMRLEAKEVSDAIHTAVRKHLDENEQTETSVNFHIGNTNTGKLIREAQMWLCNPVIKSLYDLYISDPTEFEKMAGLMEEDRVNRLLGIVMQIPQMAQKALDLPGGEAAFKLSSATFY